MDNSKLKNVIRSTFFGCLYHLSKFVMGLVSSVRYIPAIVLSVKI